MTSEFLSLSELTVHNVKSFGQKQNVRIAPITLIYGENSSGKSTILQALRLLKLNADHSTTSERTARDAHFRGDNLDLGSFETAVFKHDIRRHIEIEIGWRIANHDTDNLLTQWARLETSNNVLLPPSLYPEAGRGRRFGVSISATSGHEDDRQHSRRRPRIEATQYSVETVTGDWASMRTHNALPDADPRDTIAFELMRTSAILSSADPAHFVDTLCGDMLVSRPFSLELIPGAMPPEKHEAFRQMREDAEGKRIARLREECHHMMAQLKTGGVVAYAPFTGVIKDIDWDAMSAMNDGMNDGTTDRASARSTVVGSILSVPLRLELEASELLKSVRYLGPMRSAPLRVYAAEPARRNHVGGQGEHTYHLLAQEPDLCMKVNRWLREKFWTQYELVVSHVSLDAAGELLAVGLIDGRTKTPVSPQDVGYGIGQLLPVISLAVAEDPTIICVEQPEIHLHPRLQGHVADLMIETAARQHGSPLGSPNGNHRWIAETHSEAIVRRLQRRIREGRLDHRDVSVLYVSRGPGGESLIEELRLDDTGDFIDEWPGGFFEEAYRDVFAPPPTDDELTAYGEIVQLIEATDEDAPTIDLSPEEA